MSNFFKNSSNIIIKGLEIDACHGVNSDEKINSQKWIVNAFLNVDISKASVLDDLNYTINYAKVSKYIVSFFKNNCFNLIETLADRLASELLINFELIHGIKLEVRKPNAPMNQTFDYVGVSVEKSWIKTYIALGSNLGNKNEYLDNAVDLLMQDKSIRFIKESRRIETKPYGGVADQDFLNSCAEIYTIYTPQELLDVLHNIEAHENRNRDVHWGNRTLDLDIIYYGDYIVDEHNLKIPHVDMQNRIFVLDPLCQLCPKKIHPILGVNTETMLNKLLNF